MDRKRVPKPCHRRVYSFDSTTSRSSTSSDFDEFLPSAISRRRPPPPSSTPPAVLSTATKSKSRLGRVSSGGLGKAVEVIDKLGSSMSNLKIGNGFLSRGQAKGVEISMLAFEVANIIFKGESLMQLLSKERIKHLKKVSSKKKKKYLKEVVLHLEGIQDLISEDADESLRLAAADMREELKIFSRAVARLGNLCKDPQYHHLDHYFSKLAAETTPQKQFRNRQDPLQLRTLVGSTTELYHELHALDILEHDYRRRLQEADKPSTAQREDILVLREKLKNQKEHVSSLKKKSLWSKTLEEVMKKLLDIVQYLHSAIQEAFDGDVPARTSSNDHLKLGPAGLDLHYANIILQIPWLVSSWCFLPYEARDSLYQRLPATIKAALESKLPSLLLEEELDIKQIKDEMEKTLQWLVPVATNTIKAHHGFDWVAEWASTKSEVNRRKPTAENGIIRIKTLYHADKHKTEAYILQLLLHLHCIAIHQSRSSSSVGIPTRVSPRDWITYRLRIAPRVGGFTHYSPYKKMADHYADWSVALDIIDGIDESMAKKSSMSIDFDGHDVPCFSNGVSPAAIGVTDPFYSLFVIQQK